MFTFELSSYYVQKVGFLKIKRWNGRSEEIVIYKTLSWIHGSQLIALRTTLNIFSLLAIYTSSKTKDKLRLQT